MPAKSGPLRSVEARAVKASVFEQALDEDNRHRNSDGTQMPGGGVITRSSFESGFARIAKEKKEWAGLPVPLMGERLVIEKSYTYADEQDSLNAITKPTTKTEEELDPYFRDAKIRNSWWSSRLRSTVLIFQAGDGTFTWGKTPGVHHLTLDISTLGCADAWSLETEFRAMDTLRSLISHRQFRQYLMTGTFIESSKRSGVFYLFRRLKPTIAMSGSTGKMRTLCALCQHPVAYYEGSWAGAQCPTDDVIAHYSLMKGDEVMLWKRSNQHHPGRPEAGI